MHANSAKIRGGEKNEITLKIPVNELQETNLGGPGKEDKQRPVAHGKGGGTGAAGRHKREKKGEKGKLKKRSLRYQKQKLN